MLMRAPLREGAVAMRFAVILAVLALIGVAGVWLFAGRQLVLLLDCIATGPAEALAVGAYVYWPPSLKIGDARMYLSGLDGNSVNAAADQSDRPHYPGLSLARTLCGHSERAVYRNSNPSRSSRPW